MTRWLCSAQALQDWHEGLFQDLLDGDGHLSGHTAHDEHVMSTQLASGKNQWAGARDSFGVLFAFLPIHTSPKVCHSFVTCFSNTLPLFLKCTFLSFFLFSLTHSPWNEIFISISSSLHRGETNTERPVAGDATCEAVFKA